jgi:hypothetical protein
VTCSSLRVIGTDGDKTVVLGMGERAGDAWL